MGWKVVNLDSPDLPKLLVKAYFDHSGYRIHLTDLSRIWSESVNKDDITQRALDSGSSIDPSEDDEQFKIFLGKIESALDGEDGTILNITNAGGADHSNLRIDLTAPLPKPLSPFKWTLHLQRQPEQHIESELVRPLVLRSSNLSRQVQQLIDELHNKDRVIAKICDRLETSGNDLTTVFPGVSNIKTSRKKGQREQLAKYVKGLEDFNEYAWRQAQQANNTDELVGKMINDVFRDLPPVHSSASHQVGSDWWKQLSGGLQAKVSPRFNTSPHGGGSFTNDSSAQQSQRTQDDEFQRQGTPPNRKTDTHEVGEQDTPMKPSDAELRKDSNEAGPTKEIDDESTEDEENDLDAPPRRKKHSQQLRSVSEQNEVSTSPKKFGTIGGRTHESVVASEADQMPGKATAPTNSGSKLGTIGGKPKRPAEPEAVEDVSSAQDSVPWKTSKMGVIGGKKAPSSPSSPLPTERETLRAPADDPPLRISKTPAKETTPAPQEDLEELADQKRDQLKRELEDKAKAPVKKKRKF